NPQRRPSSTQTAPGSARAATTSASASNSNRPRFVVLSAPAGNGRGFFFVQVHNSESQRTTDAFDPSSHPVAHRSARHAPPGGRGPETVAPRLDQLPPCVLRHVRG